MTFQQTMVDSNNSYQTILALRKFNFIATFTIAFAERSDCAADGAGLFLKFVFIIVKVLQEGLIVH